MSIEKFANINTPLGSKKTNNFFEINSEIKKFGGIQKFVLLKLEGEYVLGSFADTSHSGILEKMNLVGGHEILGGGLFKFYNNNITIDTSFLSSKLGPIKMAKGELKMIMQDIVGSKYKVELSE